MNSKKESYTQHFTFSHFRIHAGEFTLGTALCDPVGKSLHHHCNEVPDHVNSISSSVTTCPARGKDHNWEHKQHTAHQALCTAQHTSGAGAGSAVKAPVTFGTSLRSEIPAGQITIQQFQRSHLGGGFRY